MKKWNVMIKGILEFMFLVSLFTLTWLALIIF